MSLRTRLLRALGLAHTPLDRRGTIPPAPRLEPIHVANARVLPHRDDILPLLVRGGAVAEVGVAFGDFSARMLEMLQPRRFVAIDLFGLHELPAVWQRDTRTAFGGRTHEEHYRARFAAEIARGQVEVLRGTSWDVVAGLADGAFDLIYVDASHDYDSVVRDLAACRTKVAPGGVIAVNDYTIADPLLGEVYGVVQATHEFCLRHRWEIAYLALQEHLFCDVVLRAMAPPPAHVRT